MLHLIQWVIAVLALGLVALYISSLDRSGAPFAAAMRTVMLGLAGDGGYTKLKEVVEKRATVWEQAKALMTETDGRSMTAEELARYDAMEKELDALDAEEERLKKTEAREERYGRVETDPIVNPGNEGERGADEAEKQYRETFAKFLRRGVGRLTSDEQAVMERGLSADKEMRALAEGTGSAGGYLVPNEYRDEFIKRMKDYGSVQRVAQVIQTDTGANLSWPTMDETAAVGAILAENTQMAELDVAVGTASLDAYMYTSKITRASYQLVQDSAFDVEGTVKDAHSERIARILNQHFTTGTGTAQPDGIVTSAVSGVTAASATAITSDEVIDLVHSLDPAYRNSPRARFMLSDTALKAIRKLKASGSGEYLWQPSVQAGVPSLLFGYPYEVNQDMAAPATGVKSVLFGDFQAGYLVRIVRGIQVITFAERYADYLQVAWASYMRADGTAQNTAAYRALTQA